MQERDLGVIGGGPAGYVAALRASQLGAKVTLVEENKLGGLTIIDPLLYCSIYGRGYFCLEGLTKG